MILCAAVSGPRLQGARPEFSVMPARYGAFLAQRRKLGAQDAIVHPLNGPTAGDNNPVLSDAGPQAILGPRVSDRRGPPALLS